MPPEVLSVEQARAAGLGKPYPDTDEGNELLEARIIGEEQRLARYIGPLTGERTVTTYLNGRPYLWLPRRPIVDASLDIELNGVALDAADYRIESTGELVLVAGGWSTGLYELTFEPDDEELVRTVLIDLLRLSLTETGMQSESIGKYSYSRGGVTATSGTAQRRREIIAPLMVHEGIGV